MWNLPAILLAPGTLLLWLPWVLIGAASRLPLIGTAGKILLPVVLALALAGFYAILYFSGTSLEQAEDASLLLGPLRPVASCMFSIPRSCWLPIPGRSSRPHPPSRSWRC